jgi:hypothetical protein
MSACGFEFSVHGTRKDRKFECSGVILDEEKG